MYYCESVQARQEHAHANMHSGGDDSPVVYDLLAPLPQPRVQNGWPVAAAAAATAGGGDQVSIGRVRERRGCASKMSVKPRLPRHKTFTSTSVPITSRTAAEIFSSRLQIECVHIGASCSIHRVGPLRRRALYLAAVHVRRKMNLARCDGCSSEGKTQESGGRG